MMGGSSKAQKLAALAAMRAAKAASKDGGGAGAMSRLAQLASLEDEDDRPVYEVVDEEEYRKRVAKRRHNDDFVVDDDGHGYADDGEDFVDVHMSTDRDARGKPVRGAGGLSSKSLKQAKSLNTGLGAQTSKVTTLFAAQSAKTKASGAESKQEEAAMDDLLNELDEVVHKKPVAPTGRVTLATASFASPAAGGASKPKPAVMEDVYEYSRDYEDVDMERPVPAQTSAVTSVTAAAAAAAAPSSDAAQEPAQLSRTARRLAALSAQATRPKPAPEPVAPVTAAVSSPPTAAESSSSGRAGGLAAAMASPSAAPDEELLPEISAATRALLQSNDVTELVESSSTPGSSAQVEIKEGDEVFMYWIDAYEDTKHGILYLFGKAMREKGVFQSCCVKIHDLERVCYVLPRDKGDGTRYTAAEASQEVQALLRSLNVQNKASADAIRMRPVKRKYCFELGGIPREESEYLEVRFPPTMNAVSNEHAATARTFSHVFGSSTSMMEQFLLGNYPCRCGPPGTRCTRHDLLGPCWVRIKNATNAKVRVSNARMELTVPKPMCITTLTEDEIPGPAPKLTTCSLAIKTVLNQKNTHEISMVTMVINNKVNMDSVSSDAQHNVTFVCPTSAVPLPCALVQFNAIVKKDFPVGSVIHCQNEKALLQQLMARIHEQDPDVLVGHNLIGFDLDVLLHRMSANKTGNWSMLGRLKRSELPNMRDTKYFINTATAGRLLCDTYLVCRELVRESSYTLSTLAANHLKVQRPEFDIAQVRRCFQSAEELFKLVRHNQMDGILIQQLMLRFNMLPLTKQITNLAGNLWARTLQGARAERIEYLLLHEFNRLDYLVPDKEHKGSSKGGRTRAKPSYTGGLVLEPKRGLHDSMILYLDFNSLYPSIIQEYNICFTTVQRKLQEPQADAKDDGPDDDVPEAAEDEDGDDEDGTGEVVVPDSDMPALPDREKFRELAILPRVIRMLVERRREVKKLLSAAKASSDEATRAKAPELDIRQQALKILANSMYGCLGFANSRFFARSIAALVTSQGRSILQSAVHIVEAEKNLEVVYGDTDSIMINTRTTDLEEVKRIATDVKSRINALYKCLVIDVDGIFRKMLLLKKKKYAALLIKEEPGGGGRYSVTKETKGLDLVRRDWCDLSRKLGNDILDIILSDKDNDTVVNEIHAKLQSIGKAAREGKINIAEFAVRKGLGKAAKDYPPAALRSMPHLQVALRMQSQGVHVNVGSIIPYVICTAASCVDADRGVSPAAVAAGAASDAAAPATSSGSPSSPAATRPMNEPTTPDATTARDGTSVTPPAAATPAAATPSGVLATPAAPSGPSYNELQDSFALRARHPSEVFKSRGVLQVDVEWYLSNQILPPISRLCESVAGTSAAQLAECLGLDASKFHRTYTNNDAEDEDMALKALLSQEDYFRDVDKLQAQCLRCGETRLLEGLFIKQGDKFNCGLQCNAVNADGSMCGGLYGAVQASKGGIADEDESYVSAVQLANLTTLSARRHILEYLDSKLVCDEPTCTYRNQATKRQRISREGAACVRRCPGSLRFQCSAEKLHTQLDYYEALCNPIWASCKAKALPAVPVVLDEVQEGLSGVVSDLKSASAYEIVDMSWLTGLTADAK